MSISLIPEVRNSRSEIRLLNDELMYFAEMDSLNKFKTWSVQDLRAFPPTKQRTKGTCEWILTSSEFQCWAKSKQSEILWIHGHTGKFLHDPSIVDV